jgi:hypothetical protein
MTNTNTNDTTENPMNAPLSNLESRTAAAAQQLAAKGADSLGHLVTFHFSGLEMPVSEAVQYAQEADLVADDLPDLRDRSAVRKALTEVGIHPSARHNSKAETAASQAAGEASCYRYSSVKGEGGDELYQVFEEREEATGVVQVGEVQRLIYRAAERKLEVTQPLLRHELEAAFSKWRGAYKSDSIRTLAARTLARVGATKLAGTTWFVPPTVEADEVLSKLRTFVRKLDPSHVEFLAHGRAEHPRGPELQHVPERREGGRAAPGRAEQARGERRRRPARSGQHRRARARQGPRPA